MRLFKSRLAKIIFCAVIVTFTVCFIIFFGFIYAKNNQGKLKSGLIFDFTDEAEPESDADLDINLPDPIASKKSIIYFPVDKATPFPYKYVPETVVIDSIKGTPAVDPVIKQDLLNMVEAMINSGLDPQVVSSYRSYESQVVTFDQWVSYEMSLGNTKEQAVLNASTYSAQPGHSEHQLGTAIDITQETCNMFDRSCQANIEVWNWLAQNAYKYGFAISYPQGKDAVTGYIHEAWHYRWIGHDLALEFKNRTDGIVLRDFLIEKNMY